MKERFYLVSEEALPQAITDTARARGLLESGRAASLAEALAAVGISKSTYYKYKDRVFAFTGPGEGEQADFSLNLGDEKGVLSGVLNTVAASGANVLAIHQNLPAMGSAEVSLTVAMTEDGVSVPRLAEALSAVPGVRSVRLSGLSSE